ncbi:protein kinase [Candidatus Uabimicrobium sp. HlEnr_7]|uniref:protein kinase domain-containing protein n=1 Tax=Candidatus Uabimicrobium helgolandensis TaxID=3095367 RepID=UPI003556A2DC
MSENKEFGKFAVKLGFITKEQLYKYLNLQRLLKEKGVNKILSEILVQKKVITGLDAKAIAQQIPTSTQAKNLQENTTAPTPPKYPGTSSSKTQKYAKKAQRFGRYEIQKILGQGGSATVYKVYDPRMDREAALKVLTLGQVATQKQLQRFNVEIKTTARLQHPNIVTIYETNVQNNIPYFIMDFVPGINLKQFIYRQKPSIEQSLSIIKTVTKAIGYAHNQGVIHRDLKPENIMMENNQNPKIMDFGLAKLTDSETELSRTGEILGTVKYMSPEQAEGIKNVDERTDLYAIGVIFYEMLVRQAPFEGQSYLQILNQVINSRPISPSKINQEVPRDLEIICLKAIRKKEENRYQSAEELLKALNDFSAGKKITKVPAKRTNINRNTQRAVGSRITQRIADQNSSKNKIPLSIMVVVMISLSLFIFLPRQDKTSKLRKTVQQSKEKKNEKKQSIEKHNNENKSNNTTQKNTIDQKKNILENKLQKHTQQNKIAAKINNQNAIQNKETEKDNIFLLEEEARKIFMTIPVKGDEVAIWKQIDAVDKKYEKTRAWQYMQRRKNEIENNILRELLRHLPILQRGHKVTPNFWPIFHHHLSFLKTISQRNPKIKHVLEQTLVFYKKQDIAKKMAEKLKNPKIDINLPIEEKSYNFYFHRILLEGLVKISFLDQEILKISEPKLKQYVQLHFGNIKKQSSLLRNEMQEILSKKTKEITVTLKNNQVFSGKVSKTHASFFRIHGTSKKIFYLGISAKNMVKILGESVKKHARLLAIHFFSENDFEMANKYWGFVAKDTENYNIWKTNLQYFAKIHKQTQIKVHITPAVVNIEQTVPILLVNNGEAGWSDITAKLYSKGKVISQKNIPKLPANATKYIHLPFLIESAKKYSFRLVIETKEKVIHTKKLDINVEKKKYGFYADIWKKLYYRHNGNEIVDMSSPFWLNSTSSKKKYYAKTYQKYYAKFFGKKTAKVVTIQGTKINMIFVPPGRFLMGSPKHERGRNAAEISHKVVLSKAFWIQREEMSRQIWERITKTTPWNKEKDSSPLYPATYLSYNIVTRDLLSKMDKKFNFPTEAEWEYSCRAGSTDIFFWGKSPKKGSLYTWNSYNHNKQHPAIVRQKKPNHWGIFDMLGNVSEICRDSVSNYTNQQQIDPYYQNNRDQKRARGGNYTQKISVQRCAFRENSPREKGTRTVGLRLIMYE